jgi:DNA-binding transcriptional MerR regulator
MMGRRTLAVGIILIMTMAVVPVYALAGNAGSQNGGEHGTVANVTTNVTLNATGLQRASGVLLRIVDRLANYTAALMANSTNVSNETVTLFKNAEELRKEAWSLYNNGSYKEALHTAIVAMKDYKRVIVSIKCGPEVERERPDNATIAKVEALRMRGYFIHVGMLIKAAKAQGLNVTKVEELYNETREAYKKVVVDAMSGNATALREDLPKARELKEELDQAIRELMRQFVMKHAHGIANAFTWKLNMQIWALKRLQNFSGVNVSAIQNLTQQLIQLRQNVTELIREGKIKEALQLIRTSLPNIRMAAFRLRWIQKHEGMYWPVHHGRGHGTGHGHH